MNLLPECQLYILFLFLLSVVVEAVIVHHHDELPQVQLSVVVHVHPRHQTVDLCMGWIFTKSSQQWTKLSGAEETTLVLVKLLEDFSHLGDELIGDVQIRVYGDCVLHQAVSDLCPELVVLRTVPPRTELTSYTDYRSDKVRDGGSLSASFLHGGGAADQD